MHAHIGRCRQMSADVTLIGEEEAATLVGASLGARQSRMPSSSSTTHCWPSVDLATTVSLRTKLLPPPDK